MKTVNVDDDIHAELRKHPQSMNRAIRELLFNNPFDRIFDQLADIKEWMSPTVINAEALPIPVDDPCTLENAIFIYAKDIGFMASLADVESISNEVRAEVVRLSKEK